MDKDMLEQFQMIIQGMGDMEKRLTTQIEVKIKESETRINLKLENEVAKRIDALFDGYKLTHEKQWELERETEALKETVADLQNRLAALESEIA